MTVAENRRLADVEAKGDAAVPGVVSSRNAANSKDPNALLHDVRMSDIEPYTGLRYLSTLFRVMAVILALLLVAEVVTGMYTQGAASLPTLLGEASRLVVLAGVLWGTGDLAHLLIDVGHDIRAARILVARVAHSSRPSGMQPDSGRSSEPVVADRISISREL